jgi:polysaccharide biosynthesis/export protein
MPRSASLLPILFIAFSVYACARPAPQSAPTPRLAGSELSAEDLAYLDDAVTVARPAARSENGEPRIGPNDLLQITVFEAAELSRPIRVSGEGEISMPLLGTIPVTGLTARELENELTSRLRRQYMHDPQVTVEVAEAQSASVYVFGEVVRAGAFLYGGTDRITVLQAITLGQGLKANAAKERIFVVRSNEAGGRTQIPVNLGEVLAGRAVDMPLQPNDIVVVPRNNTRSFLVGALSALLGVITLRTAF